MSWQGKAWTGVMWMGYMDGYEGMVGIGHICIIRDEDTLQDFSTSARTDPAKTTWRSSPVRLRDTLELILFLKELLKPDKSKANATNLDGVRVGRTLGSVDELIRKALGNRLDVAESRFTGLKNKRFRT